MTGLVKNGATPQKSSQKIINLIREDEKTTIEELAAEPGISDRAIKKHPARLKQAGVLRRIGPDKGGHWQLVNISA